MMFQGAFTTDFYRALADALHVEVRDGPRRRGRAPGTTCWRCKRDLRARSCRIWISC